MKVSDEIIISALLSEKTVSAAAKKCGISERSVYTRTKSADFQKEFAAARKRVLESTLDDLRAVLSAAITTIHSVIRDETATPAARLNACNLAFTHFLKLSEYLENCSQKARENPFDIFDPLNLC